MSRPRRVDWVAILTALLCAAPTLAYAAWSPSLIVDDWALAAAAKYLDWRDSVAPYRPLGGIWVRLSYLVLGTSPVAQAVLLAILNGVTGALVWATFRRFTPPRVAILATAAWTVMANRGSTRLWAVTGPMVISLAVLLAALLLVRRGGQSALKHLVIVAAAVSSVLAYEGAGGFAVAVVVASACCWRGRYRFAALAVGGAALGGVSLLALLSSPKVGGARPFANSTRWLGSQLGVGILPSSLSWIAVFWIGAVIWSGATFVLPSFQSRSEERLIVAGTALALLGALPFLVSGYPVATDGLFDRANIYADVGTALVIGGCAALLWRVPGRLVGPVLSSVVLGCLASQNVRDVRAFHDAGVDGRRLLAEIDAMPADVRLRGPLVLPDLPNRSGVSMFVEDYDISAALALRYDTGHPYPDATMELTAFRHRTR